MMAQALAPTGALMAFLSLWTGAFWGKPMWGTWWVWDARLTSELILLFLVDIAGDSRAQQLVRGTNSIRYHAEQIERRVGVSLHEGQQLPALELKQLGIHHRNRAGSPRTRVQKRDFPKHFARVDYVEQQTLALVRGQLHPHLAALIVHQPHPGEEEPAVVNGDAAEIAEQ
jgi:hypothetical protein